MTQSAKLFLGAVTFWPIVYMVLFMIFIFSTITMAPADPTFMGTTFPMLMVAHMVTIFMSFGLMVYYIVHAVRDESLEGDNKIIWVLVITMAGILGMPVYWWMRVWNGERDFVVREPV